MTNTAWMMNAITGAPSYTGRMVRQAMSALLGGATSTRPLGARSGVRIGTPTSTVTATSTVWTVNPHSGVLDVQTSPIAGPYLYAIDTAVTGTVTAADATYSRVDIVYVQVSDNAEDGSGAATVTPLYLAGTPAPSPSAPATPVRSMLLATINVPVSGGGSPSVVWSAPYAAAAGGIVPVRNATELGALPAGSAESPSYADQTDVTTISRNIGSGWVPIAVPATENRFSSTATATGAANADLVNGAVGVALAPGTWDVTAQATVHTTSGSGNAGLCLSVGGSGTNVDNSYGPAGYVSTVGLTCLVSQPVRIVVTSAASYYVKALNGGGITLEMTSLGSLPAASIRAVRVAA